jgi:ketosteroid isomerase-like protein
VSANLDLVKSIFARWAEGDFATADWADPDIRFEMVGGLMTTERQGIEGMADEWAKMLAAWDGLKAIPESFEELDGGRVLVLMRNEGRGKGSGIEIGGISARSANVFTVLDGRVTRLQLYWSRDDALAALGLSESS